MNPEQPAPDNESGLFEEVHELMTRWASGDLTAAQFEQFKALLKENRAARQLYVQHVVESVGLAAVLGEDERGKIQPTAAAAPQQESKPAGPEVVLPHITPAPWRTVPATRQYWRRHPVYFWTSVATLTVVLITGFFVIWQGPFEGGGGPVVEKGDDDAAAGNMVATVTGEHQPVWSTDGRHAVGDPLFPGDRLLLESGLVRLTFASGAVLLLEGPCEFTARDRGAGALEAGRLSARAREGFSIETPLATIVDVGTEFAVEVTGNQETNLHVYEGEVRLGGMHGLADRLVCAGSSFRVSAAGSGGLTGSSVDSLQDRFVRSIPAPGAWQPDAILRPQWDSFMSQFKPDQDFSDAEVLLVKHVGRKSAYEREAWLSFDLTGIDLARLADAELVLTVAPGVGKQEAAARVDLWEFEVVGMAGAKAFDGENNTWNTTRGARGKRLVTFGLAGATPVGQTVRAGGEELTRFLRESNDRSVVLVVKRVTGISLPNLANGFASLEQGETGPILHFRYRAEGDHPLD